MGKYCGKLEKQSEEGKGRASIFPSFSLVSRSMAILGADFLGRRLLTSYVWLGRGL